MSAKRDNHHDDEWPEADDLPSDEDLADLDAFEAALDAAQKAATTPPDESDPLEDLLGVLPINKESSPEAPRQEPAAPAAVYDPLDDIVAALVVPAATVASVAAASQKPAAAPSASKAEGKREDKKVERVVLKSTVAEAPIAKPKPKGGLAKAVLSAVRAKDSSGLAGVEVPPLPGAEDAVLEEIEAAQLQIALSQRAVTCLSDTGPRIEEARNKLRTVLERQMGDDPAEGAGTWPDAGDPRARHAQRMSERRLAKMTLAAAEAAYGRRRSELLRGLYLAARCRETAGLVSHEAGAILTQDEALALVLNGPPEADQGRTLAVTREHAHAIRSGGRIDEARLDEYQRSKKKDGRKG